MTTFVQHTTNPTLKVSWRYEGEGGIEEFDNIKEMEEWVEIHSYYQEMIFYS